MSFLIKMQQMSNNMLLFLIKFQVIFLKFIHYMNETPYLFMCHESVWMLWLACVCNWS